MKRTILFKNTDGLKVVLGFSHRILNNVGGRKNLSAEMATTDEQKELEDFKKINFPFKKNVNRNERKKKLTTYNTLLDKLKTKTAEVAPNHVTFFEMKPGELEISEESVVEGKAALKISRDNGKILIYDSAKVGNEFSEMQDKKEVIFYTKQGNVLTAKKLAKLTEDYPNGAIMELEGANLTLWENQELRRKNIESGGQRREGEEYYALHESALKKAKLEIQGATSADALTQATEEYNTEMTRIDDLYK